MFTELLFTIIVIGLVGALLYIIHLQKELITQPNRNEIRNVSQLLPADHKETEIQGASGLDLAIGNPSFNNPPISQILSSSVDEEMFFPIPTNLDTANEKLHESTKQNKWKLHSVSKKLSTISSKMFSVVNPKIEKEIECQDQSLINRSLKENIRKNSTINKSLNSVKIYQLKLHKIASNQTSQIKKFEFGKSKTGSYVKMKK